MKQPVALGGASPAGEIKWDLMQLAILGRGWMRGVERKGSSFVPVRLNNRRVGYSIDGGDQGEDTKQASEEPLQFSDRLIHLAI
ncbi:MAG TPA: hypothetical protein VHU83_20095 [Bryobacteraceae bacterium]|nr:hypothetical protein [Bryobacteraceae bacterium]